MTQPVFLNRDLSWLQFSERILCEAEDASASAPERIKFLSVFSSNLDEFYSVRIPVVMAMEKIRGEGLMEGIQKTVQGQMRHFGAIIERQLVPQLENLGVQILFDRPIPEAWMADASGFFCSRVMGYLRPRWIDGELAQPDLVENNSLHLAIMMQKGPEKETEIAILRVPTAELPRFYMVPRDSGTALIFLEDLIRANLDRVFPGFSILHSFTFKVTRDSDLDLRGEFKTGMVRKLEKKLMMRALGPPSRFLHEPGISAETLQKMIRGLGLENAHRVSGGRYHNLKDLAQINDMVPGLPQPPAWKPKGNARISWKGTLADGLLHQDLMIHTPYQAFDPVLRFFNEASLDPQVQSIDLTVYRVAPESLILQALMSAAVNGKKVTVFVELKARFDEANNLRWAKRLKQAGVQIIYSEPELKIHAKMALVRRKVKGGWQDMALLSTGNFNESTARFYTDHHLLTARPALTYEVHQLFRFLKKRQADPSIPVPRFEHLLVSPFDLQQKFLNHIEDQIVRCKSGKQARIVLKLNNLEEGQLIEKLYEASRQGVSIQLLVRGICCLVPGVPGLSEQIRVVRIVDRLLEHGRVAVFGPADQAQIFAGSADWMNRNIYHRIEVCFPVLDPQISLEIQQMLAILLTDNTKATELQSDGRDRRVDALTGQVVVRAQEKLFEGF